MSYSSAASRKPTSIQKITASAFCLVVAVSLINPLLAASDAAQLDSSNAATIPDASSAWMERVQFYRVPFWGKNEDFEPLLDSQNPAVQQVAAAISRDPCTPAVERIVVMKALKDWPIRVNGHQLPVRISELAYSVMIKTTLPFDAQEITALKSLLISSIVHQDWNSLQFCLETAPGNGVISISYENLKRLLLLVSWYVPKHRREEIVNRINCLGWLSLLIQANPWNLILADGINSFDRILEESKKNLRLQSSAFKVFLDEFRYPLESVLIVLNGQQPLRLADMTIAFEFLSLPAFDGSAYRDTLIDQIQKLSVLQKQILFQEFVAFNLSPGKSLVHLTTLKNLMIELFAETCSQIEPSNIFGTAEKCCWENATEMKKYIYDEMRQVFNRLPPRLTMQK